MIDTRHDVTLAELATQRPIAIAVFERHGLDYCCNGRRTLAQACAEAEMEQDEVLAEIDAAAEAGDDEAERDWTGATMTELADHIEQTHHVRARELLEVLGVLVPKVADAHGKNHPELEELRRVFPEFVEEMHDHFVREERVVFPWLRRLDTRETLHKGPPWSVKRPIDCMEHDHDAAGETLLKFRGLTDGYSAPRDACGSYRRLLELLEQLETDTHVHIHKENNILFPAGIRAEERLKAQDAGRAVANAEETDA